MLKLLRRNIYLFLLMAAIFLVASFSGLCEAKYQFNAAGVNPLWGETGVILQSFAASVRNMTEGDIEIKIFAGDWGGDEIEHCQSVQFGTLDMATPATSNISQYTNALFMFDTPFLFQDAFNEIGLVFESTTKFTPVVEKKLEQASKEAKFMVLAIAPLGRRNINSAKPIKSVADLKGMKMRVMNNPVQIDTFNFLGTNAVSLPFTELFLSLQMKTIDANEGPPIDYIMEKFYEVAPYHVVTDHLTCAQTIIMSMKAWNSLPPAYQSILKECAAGAAHTSSLWGLGSYEYYLENLIPKVSKAVVKISPEEKAELRATVLPKLLDKYNEDIGMDVLETIAESGDELISDWLTKNK